MSETLTDAERAEYDAWLQRIPSGGPEEALWNLMRLQIKHDTATIRTVSDGAFEFLGVADTRMAELVDEARAFRATADSLTAKMDGVRDDLDGFMVQSLADRADLRQSVRQLRRRTLALIIAVVVLALEMAYRYLWPLVSAALLSLALMAWSPL